MQVPLTTLAMSSLAWLDFSESDRQKALDVIDLFREKGTVDELGIGTVRDAIADLLFPGTSTIMTRAKYYFLIPWIYRRHEVKRTKSKEIAQLARRDEIALIGVLEKAGDIRGLIGIQSRASLRRLPSAIYWAGLGRLGIRRYPGGMDGYHRSLDSFYQNGGNILKGDDKNVVAGGIVRNWDPQLPEAPAHFLSESSLQLSRREADYLYERIIQSAPHSLFAFLARDAKGADGTPFPWMHSRYDEMAKRNQSELRHARNFSLVMFGASLLYNLMLAQKQDTPDLVERYSSEFQAWSAEMEESGSDLRQWSRHDFWELVHSVNSRISQNARLFIDQWLSSAMGSDPLSLSKQKASRALIEWREKGLKGPLARLSNKHALDNWRGASGYYRLDYRWTRPVRDILADLSNPTVA